MAFIGMDFLCLCGNRWREHEIYKGCATLPFDKANVIPARGRMDPILYSSFALLCNRWPPSSLYRSDESSAFHVSL
jgi:hypothetical protein